MSAQAFNPFLPLNEYIPDGEAHVFGDRVYLYGSHDKEGGKRYCMLDYTVYSAPVSDLSKWACHGVSYTKSQDPRSCENMLVDLYAPDCVCGNDGRYYLFYTAMGPNVKNFGPMSVAVSEHPQGPFSYLGDIRFADGTPMTRFLTGDPGVLNDYGRIWLYYGWGLGQNFRNRLLSPLYNFAMSKIFDRSLKEVRTANPHIMGANVVELEADMMTVKTAPKRMLDAKITADKKSELYYHAFHEAASIRKIGETYYFLWFSGHDGELCYATSKHPDKDFVYRGVIISNCDKGFRGNTKKLAADGTNHGSIERINSQWYVFYHRLTHNTNFSRQACAEPIEILPDGTIPQVEMTCQGLSGKPLYGHGIYPAVICCNLFNKYTCEIKNERKQRQQPNTTHSGNESYIKAISNGTTIGFKYLNFAQQSRIRVRVRGAAGTIIVSTKIDGDAIACMKINKSSEWSDVAVPLCIMDGVHALYFTYQGKGIIDFLEFEIMREG